MLQKYSGAQKVPLCGFFFGTMRHFSQKFWILSKRTPLNFLKFSVCKKRLLSLKGLFLGFRQYATFFTKYFFWKKISKCFQLLFLEYFWALDMAPTWAVPVLFDFSVYYQGQCCQKLDFYYDFLKHLRNILCENISLLYSTFIKLLERLIKVFVEILNLEGNEVGIIFKFTCSSVKYSAILLKACLKGSNLPSLERKCSV